MSLESPERVIGRFGGNERGPTVVIVGGLHGNEPSGVAASRRVLDKLRQRNPRFRGEFLALSGNIPALMLGRRYINEDLNRIWSRERIERVTAGKKARSEEEHQLGELLLEIDAVLKRAGPEAYFLDLHSTSAPGSAFSVFADTLRNRRLASVLPCPMVLGLEEHLQGTLLNYINERGYPAVGFEGGQNEAASSIDTHELGIWHTLAATGCLNASDIPELLNAKPDGRAIQDRLPEIVEIRHRHEIYAGEAFVMQPGFRNLGRVEKGELLAHDKHGDVRCLESGFILMPLYQAQGNDGFFLVGSVRPFWLRISAGLRAIRLGGLLRYLPGVHRRGEDTLIVNSRIARWVVVEVFHLLGFRRQRPEGRMQVFTRRREKPVQPSLS